MSDIPSDLRYAESHEWVSQEEEGVVKVGISEHAQEQLGDLVFVELPEEGETFGRGDACAVVESVKAASDIYCPVSGEVTVVNEALADTPEIVNNDPYGDGWLFSVKLDDSGELDDLMDAEAYREHLGED
ncbi:MULTISPECIES: glycine cleavage system protein GcvH [unclassified Wenzhouxiangella]|uniref:glycine cleavage system protein GcvH n=1 Tax=unclassified Wenzhouxiangella TaxID=2613841 RepID=UPI000E329918|nr:MULTISPECIES: glycine cleavage system protein GcvH [unclassified Wenzhouxiangella]RFF27188.1 glycine cleavage system protein GcvH [Wenzhouxiangella sp. 15181]RFP69125.1 glycine cleavage system protein GcvH [Wenzhouxiangella sp. 15190]